MASTILLTLALPGAAWSHGGGLNAEGCHNNRKTGDYHCHRSGGGSQNSRSSADSAPGFGFAPKGVPGSRPAVGPGASFSNCAQARAAGAAPLRRGEPGYGPHLDRDRDGVACE
ncbi:excalibur calcium-binding domain-containing protein [Hydrogenophaga sp.]|uniref:excalibur calcium-binding domain-containing protein n=1 Tax=Hydrogenophaga sp. TaxID=1904254 RepID=UPI00352423ED